MDEYIADKLDKKKKVAAPESQDGPTPALAFKPTDVD
jgi:hypothetical protein